MPLPNTTGSVRLSVLVIDDNKDAADTVAMLLPLRD